MSVSEFCRKCNTLSAGHNKPDSAFKRLLHVVGYQSFYCEKCKSGWRQLSAYQVGINFIFLFVAGTAVLLVLE